MKGRTPTGAVAWAIALISFPYVSLPLYWMFGRSRFDGYVKARRAGNLQLNQVARQAGDVAHREGLVAEVPQKQIKVLEKLALMPFLKHNTIKLLIDGDVTFAAMFAGIEQATEYILVQFFIVKDDEIGREFQARLIKKAQEGVRVYFLYDEVGSHQLPGRYLRELKEAGAHVHPFHASRRNRFQINFRNHRKIVVVDGRIAYTGGLNIGDEYLGRSERFGHWRDTHISVEGPGVHAIQLVFVEDWHWATGKLPIVDWEPRPSAGDQELLILPSGPADRIETCGLFFVHAINRARERLWIASPYFVPDQHVMCALQLAALRGVDVRIMLPEKPDHVMVYLSSFSYLGDAEEVGVKFFRYHAGFLHHKVILVDDQLAAVGSANLDNRSFRLNFEMMAVSNDDKFATEVAEMFASDFHNCREVDREDYARKPWWFKIGVKVSRLMAPLQ